MAIFGNQNVEALTQSNDDNILGGKFQMGAVGGLADSITINLWNSTPLNFKCAIYNDDDTLLGTTEEKLLDLAAGGHWIDFDFSAPKPQLVASAWYYLCGWSDESGAGSNSLVYAASGGSGMVFDAETYNGWPGTANFAAWGTDRLQSIYCTYTPVVPTESLIITRNIHIGGV